MDEILERSIQKTTDVKMSTKDPLSEPWYGLKKILKESEETTVLRKELILIMEAMEAASLFFNRKESILDLALAFEAGRNRPHTEDAIILLNMIQDKPHRAIQYISELLSDKSDE